MNLYFKWSWLHINQDNTIQAVEATPFSLNQPQGPALLIADQEKVSGTGVLCGSGVLRTYFLLLEGERANKGSLAQMVTQLQFFFIKHHASLHTVVTLDLTAIFSCSAIRVLLEDNWAAFG